MAVVVVHLLARANVCQRIQVSALIDGDAVPIGGVIVPTVVLALGPGVEVGRQSGLVAVGDTALIAGTYLGTHEEIRTIQALAAVLLAQCLECWDIDFVERQTRDMAARIDAETVNAHLDERAIAVDEVFCHSGILGIQINAVTGNLRPPARVVVPIELAEVVPTVVIVVVLVVGILHLLQARVILLARRQTVVVGRQQTAHRVGGIGFHALINLELVGIPVASEQFTQVFLAEVARVIEHHIEQHLHATGMRLVDECLECRVTAFVAVVHTAEVAGMITVVVQARGVLNDGRYPHGGETQRLDIVQFFNQALEITTPAGVTMVGCPTIPTLGVVTGIAVIETGGNHKIDALVTEIVAGTYKCRPRLLGYSQSEQQDQSQQLEMVISRCSHMKKMIKITG